MATDSDRPSLPAATIDTWPVPAATLHRLPKELAEEFEAVFYQETDTSLYLGLVHPAQLKPDATEALKHLQTQLGKEIILTTLKPEDYDRVLALYDQVDQPAVREDGTRLPANWQPGQPVAEAVLRMLPADFCRARRLVPVSLTEPNTLWLGTDRPFGQLQAVTELLARRNRLTIELLALSRAEVERVIALQQALPRLAAPVAPEPEAAPVAPVKKVDEDMVVPDISGRILSSDQERGGLSGLLQRAGLFLKAPEAPAEPAPVVAAEPAIPLPFKQSEVSKPLPVPPPPEPTVEDDTPPAEAEGQHVEPLAPTIGRTGIIESDSEETSAPSKTGFERPVTEIRQLETIVREGNVPRTVAGIINYAVHKRASDIHVEPYGDELVFRYRVDGQLNEIIKVPLEQHPAIVSRIKILAKMKLDETRIPQDGRFDAVVDGTREIDIRVSTLPTVHGEKVVMRLLDKSSGLITLENLGLKGDGFTRLIKAINKSYGVVLSTGPTGSGKTTTLYAILQRVATMNVNVVTLEDPVEYEIRGINQSQIKPKIGFTFAEGLRSILRQDPNIIMVGEVRDGETAQMVTHAALTGHLVLSTLHTNDAAGALPRLINMGIEPFLITSAMNAVIGQRLARRLNPDTKERFELPTSVRNEIDKELEIIRQTNPAEASRIPEKIEFFRPRSTAENPTGYVGRVGIFEVMLMNEEIEELAVKKATADDIQAAAVKAGMLTMRQDGILKMLEGVTSIDEVWHETLTRS